jgi:hypothetical protein
VKIACLDLEGVLVPEIWINVAERTGIDALRRTTRDEPDYDRLMRGRLEILDRHGLGLPDIQRVISSMGPLEGAREFLAWLRERFQVLILSDTCLRRACCPCSNPTCAPWIEPVDRDSRPLQPITTRPRRMPPPRHPARLRAGRLDSGASNGST